MTTLRQLCRKKNGGRKVKAVASKFVALSGSPQRKGTCSRVFHMNPRKPNSAQRPVVRVTLTTGYEVTAYVPGMGHALQEHSMVLVRAGGPADLPGVNYRVIRGVLDAKGVEARRSSRSRYGASKPTQKG
ncbi:30S ribosomal protein S12 [Candidatus Cytomitobacter indipagum]|uniref:30S ribosomal protein S12 n=1 Tax=Candidatus Cytomitobacter indipagum TaxID=2601575 RepID=A0A5C0UDX5_9PROT|nr:30S ribosomal protein S12 [Candidatus Cytomitobacter indipagum]QEK38275.1 30S ribosomal protein S12 [Candidatus Cytomitobacter indipagum]